MNKYIYNHVYGRMKYVDVYISVHVLRCINIAIIAINTN